MLKINELAFSYNGNDCKVFNDFSLTIEKGAVYGLLGLNGTGKSTLLYLLTGLLRPQEGSIEFKGEDVQKRLPSTLSDMYIVPEEFELPDMSMKKYAKLHAGFYPRFSYEQLQKNLAMFGLDDNVVFNNLSMGQQKKAYMCFSILPVRSPLAATGSKMTSALIWWISFPSTSTPAGTEAIPNSSWIRPSSTVICRIWRISFLPLNTVQKPLSSARSAPKPSPETTPACAGAKSIRQNFWAPSCAMCWIQTVTRELSCGSTATPAPIFPISVSTVQGYREEKTFFGYGKALRFRLCAE